MISSLNKDDLKSNVKNFVDKHSGSNHSVSYSMTNKFFMIVCWDCDEF